MLTPIQIRTRAEHLMSEHGLLARGWRFEFDRAVKRFGLCSYRRQTISLSKHLCALNTDEEIVDTILHEIAHALVGPGEGHRWRWRRMARQIGAVPRTCAGPGTRIPTGRWEATCHGCARTFKRFKTPRRNGSTCCARCARETSGRAVYMAEYRLQFVKVQG